MREYEMEELIPIVADLTEKYTSKESTSVTYERAAHLMEAVLYCIRACESEHALVAKDGLTAQQAYQIGYEKIQQKVSRAKKQYADMIPQFRSYGNENYQDTFFGGITGFFERYDPRFAPQENIITMDYPVLLPLNHLSGINAVEQYLWCIRMEQTFLNEFDERYVMESLKSFQKGYQKEFYNLCSIFLRHILGKMMVLLLTPENETEAYTVLETYLKEHTPEQIRELAGQTLHTLIQQHWAEKEDIEKYLALDLDNFVTDLKTGAEHAYLQKVVVL